MPQCTLWRTGVSCNLSIANQDEAGPEHQSQVRMSALLASTREVRPAGESELAPRMQDMLDGDDLPASGDLDDDDVGNYMNDLDDVEQADET